MRHVWELGTLAGDAFMGRYRTLVVAKKPKMSVYQFIVK